MTFLRCLKLFRGAIKKYINDNGKPRFIHVHVPMKAGLLALWAKRRYDIPFIVTEHWAIYNQFAPDAFYKRRKRFRYLLKSIIEKADKLLMVSNDLGKSINNWVTEKEFEVVPNVVDTHFFYFHPEWNPQNFRFIHVSTMEPSQKRPKDIVDAFIRVHAEFNNAELYMVGPTPGDIYQYARATGELNQSVFFTGEISYADVAKELQKSNAFILCSRYENQPCSILEALCCGLPVIAASVGGIPEVINASNGILIEPQNVDSLAQAMKKMMSDYHLYEREKISLEAKKRFSYDVVGKMFDSAYSLDKPKSSSHPS